MSNSRNIVSQSGCPYTAGSVDVATGATPETPGDATWAQAFGAGPIDVYWSLQDASTPPKFMAGIGSLSGGSLDVSAPMSTFDGTTYDDTPAGVIALVSPVTARCTLNASVFDDLSNRGLESLADVNGPLTYAANKFLRGNDVDAYEESVIPLSFPAHWIFSDITTATDPGVGDFKQNAATMAATTELYINSTTSSGIDLSKLIKDVTVGQKLFLLQENHIDRAAFYEVASNPVDNTGWWTIGVIFHAQGDGGEFQDGKNITFQFVGIGGVGPQSDYTDMLFPTYATFATQGATAGLVSPIETAIDFATSNKQAITGTVSITIGAWTFPGIGSYMLSIPATVTVVAINGANKQEFGGAAYTFPAGKAHEIGILWDGTVAKWMASESVV